MALVSIRAMRAACAAFTVTDSQPASQPPVKPSLMPPLCLTAESAVSYYHKEKLNI